MDEEKDDRAVNCPLFTVDSKAEMTNFDRPCDANYVFPWVEEQEDRWRTTIRCLNDPNCAKAYDPTGKVAYPLPLLLTIIVICKEHDPSVKLPMIVSSEKKAVFKLADNFAYRLSGSGTDGSADVDDIVQKLAGLAEKLGSHATCSDKEWKAAYQYCKALILKLSRAFGNDNANWYYTDDVEGLHSVSSDMVTAFGTVLLNPPSNETKQLLSKDLDHIKHHLKEGNFVQFVEDEDFADEFPDAVKTWEQLNQLAPWHTPVNTSKRMRKL
jgi:hypothetical protein